uniref:Phosphoglycolate phosphatase n=1 Tax=Thermosporothrix sp. COM3 TaxID=2490863 RepID=A0A455SUB7_9CHLR|nr:phosphoglycolate phosphatase [Thermosporothrix sp. COM3]
MAHPQGVIFDIDGTLIDSNDAHAYAWVEAFQHYGYQVPFDKVRPLIGMGGDKLLPDTVGLEKDSEKGKQISQLRKKIFMERYLPDLKPFPMARELLHHIHDEGLKMAIATSAEKDELDALLAVIGPYASHFFEEETSSKDAPRSKPSPDVMQATVERIGLAPEQLVMLGDTAYDIEAAKKVGIQTIALRCGGWSDQDLQGAIAIYDDPADLFHHYEESPLTNL